MSTGVELEQLKFSVFPNPSADLIAIQVNGLNPSDLTVDLTDMAGRRIRKTVIRAGQTIAYFDVQALYAGTYLVTVSSENARKTFRVVVGDRSGRSEVNIALHIRWYQKPGQKSALQRAYKYRPSKLFGPNCAPYCPQSPRCGIHSHCR